MDVAREVVRRDKKLSFSNMIGVHHARTRQKAHASHGKQLSPPWFRYIGRYAFVYAHVP
jgi:hypothetical protein